MTRSVWVTSLGSEFDDFLFAPICEDGNGILLSVISALARLDLDPWQEAVQLAGLPGETATKRLASLIAALPDGQSAHSESGTIAARLIALLPRRVGPNAAVGKAVPGAAVPNNWAIVGVIIIFFVLGSQWIAASRQPPAQADIAHVPSSTAFAPQISLPKSDR